MQTKKTLTHTFFPHEISLCFFPPSSNLIALPPPSVSSSRSITLCTDHLIYAFQPGHVSSYLFCGLDLIKIMRNELFDQDLLTTRHRPAPDKPGPCLSASFFADMRLSLHLHPYVDVMTHSSSASFFSHNRLTLLC